MATPFVRLTLTTALLLALSGPKAVALPGAPPPPPPPPPPGAITPAMTLGYTDLSHVRQWQEAEDLVTTVTGVAPFSVEFFCGDTRSAELDGNTAHGAWWNIGYYIDYGEGAGGTWSLSGLPRDSDRGFPLFFHTYRTPGTYQVRMTCRDSAGNQSFIRVNVVVTAPGAGVDLTSGVIPVWTDNTIYNAPAGGTWGPTNFRGRRGILIRKTGVGANPIFGAVTLDDRNEPNEVITQTANVKFLDCDVANVAWGGVGFTGCSFTGGRVRGVNPPPMMYLAGQLIANGRTALQVANLRMFDGLYLQDTGEMNPQAGSSYVIIGDWRSWHCKNVFFHRDATVATLTEHNLRGIGRMSSLRHCLFSNSTSVSRSYNKFQGHDCTQGVALPSNKGTPDTWPADGTVMVKDTPSSPTATGGRLLGLPSSYFGIVDCIYGTAADGPLEASIGFGPENNDLDQPAQAVEFCGHEYCRFYQTTTWYGPQYTGLSLGLREVRLNMGAGAVFAPSFNGGANRLPDGWAGGPYVSSGTRPVPIIV